MADNVGYRSGFVVLAGRPNVGKSTLVNRLVGRKVSIVSEKPQTTRHRIAGVFTGESFQIVFIDIPGFQRPFDELTRRMQETVDAALDEADAALFMLAADEPIGGGDRFIAARLAATGTPTVVAVNKVDLVGREELRRIVEQVEELGSYERVRLISALTGHGVGDVVRDLVELLPEGPQYFPDHVVTDRPEEWLVAEIIREKVLHETEEEVPHAVSVEVIEMEPREGKDLIDIRAAIYVERDSQKPIIIGEGGSRIKRIGTEARREIEALLGSRVFLDLVVQVRKGWRRDPVFLRRLGI